MATQPEFQKQLQSIEKLLAGIEAVEDPRVTTDVRELLQIVMDLHGAGIERMLELIRAEGESGESLVSKIGRDDLAGSLLVLYGIHPVTLEARITEAVESARRRLRSREGEVELLSMEDGAVRLRLSAGKHSCGSTAQALKEIVEDAVYGMAPDVSLFIEIAEETRNAFVPLEMLKPIATAPRVADELVLTSTEPV
jgi:Fe-S cluster biogenesis protein NfuA